MTIIEQMFYSVQHLGRTGRARRQGARPPVHASIDCWRRHRDTRPKTL